jgi:hypothetical protein
MTETRVAILNAGSASINGDIYPRDVIERAINLWNGQTMAVIHGDRRACERGPQITDAIGVASHIRFDEETQQVLADVKFKIDPERLKDCQFEPDGVIVRDGSNITDFKMTALVIAPGAPEDHDDY